MQFGYKAETRFPYIQAINVLLTYLFGVHWPAVSTMNPRLAHFTESHYTQ